MSSLIKQIDSYCFMILLFASCINVSFGQSKSNTHSTLIIEKIKALESQKDAKCHATANRLEDFIYGSPLDEGARNRRIDIQKAFIEQIKVSCSQLALAENLDSIYLGQIKMVIDPLVSFGRIKNGDWWVENSNERLMIKALDFDQYSSISYAYRSLLSVEQDFAFFDMDDNLPFAKESIEPIYKVVNLVTLATLKIADQKCRVENRKVLTEEDISYSWISLFENIKNIPRNKASDLDNAKTDDLIAQIIAQKLQSYENYNQNISSAVFLRNIQVYFAKQRWPTEAKVSLDLKNYYLESLIAFADALLLQSSKYATLDQSRIVRINHVQQSLRLFTPFSVNLFEDICFFPNMKEQSITIESYDLDAFRDSGWHWQILSYALEDKNTAINYNIDPNSAELIVEGIAQLGVLILRMAGTHSQEVEKRTLDQEDITQAFAQVQSMINGYSEFESIENNERPIWENKITETTGKSFEDHTNESKISYLHKSADWLSRFIRSYVYEPENNTAKLAIPPAFGGSGVATEDIDNDGDIDMLLLGGLGNILYLNDGEGEFHDSEQEEALNIWHPILQSFGEPRQPIIADFDNDGWQDIFISYVDDNHLMVKNIEGKAFKKMNTNLGGKGLVGGPATALDYNNDGLLDIFIGYFGSYINGTLPTLGRNDQNGLPNKLFINKGDFIFEEVAFNQAKNTGWTQALGHTDINQDGYQDLIVGNDFGTNEYYLNNQDGSFIEQSKVLGTDKPSYTMNVGIGDINQDLYPDIYISNIVLMQKEEKYVNPSAETTMKFDPEKMARARTVEANDLFVSNPSAEHLVSFTQYDKMGRGYSSTGWSWDADFFDYDNDGDNDLYCLNGMNDFSVYSQANSYYQTDTLQDVVINMAQSHKERNVFFKNTDSQFINVAEEVGLDVLSNSRSASYFDFDNDGDLDIATNNYHDFATVHENKLGQNSNWIKIKLEGNPAEQVNRDAIGAVIIAQSASHQNLWREVHSTDGYLSSHPKVQHIGLSEDSYVDITIKWPNQKSYTFKNLEANKTYKVIYPDELVEFKTKD